MNEARIISELKALGNPKNVAIWHACGVKPNHTFFGVSITNLKKLARKIKRDHALAVALWDAGVHDARLLATFIEEPKKVNEMQLSRQVCSICTPDVSDKFVTNVVLKTPFAQSFASQWINRNEEFIKQCGYLLIAGMAKKTGTTSDAFFSFYLTKIAAEISAERNWVREAMNLAIISIGKRSKNLQNKALQLLENTAPVRVDYGTSSCTAPDAKTALRKHLF